MSSKAYYIYIVLIFDGRGHILISGNWSESPKNRFLMFLCEDGNVVIPYMFFGRQN
jgi:hypothetical protein